VYSGVQDQMQGYISRLNNPRNIAVAPSTALQHVYSDGWAVSFFNKCWDRAGESDFRWLIAWAPMEGDPGTGSRTAEELAGHLYYDSRAKDASWKAPQAIVDRSESHMADDSYQRVCSPPEINIRRPPVKVNVHP
jgi:hypothetical protein